MRLAAQHPVAFHPEAVADDHAGDARQDHQRQHPGAQRGHQGAHGAQRHDRARQGHELRGDAKGPRADLPPRLLEAVVRVGVLEGLDAQGGGLVEDAAADRVLQGVPEQLLRGVLHGADQVAHDDQRDLHGQQRQQRPVRDLSLRGAGDLVQQQLADVQVRGGQGTPGEAGRGVRPGVQGAGLPHQRQRGAQVTQPLAGAEFLVGQGCARRVEPHVASGMGRAGSGRGGRPTWGVKGTDGRIMPHRMPHRAGLMRPPAGGGGALAGRSGAGQCAAGPGMGRAQRLPWAA